MKKLREPVLFSFVLDKPPRNNIFCNPETIQFRKLNKIVSSTILFYPEDDDDSKNVFTGEILAFTLQIN